jgi:NitT/TauT family transport system permease protein
MILFGAVFSITHATEQGMRQVNPTWVRAARTMGSSGWHLSRTVLLPAALPSIVTGLKQGWAFAWRALMTAELVTEGLGFGNLLKAGQKNKDMAMLLAMIFVIMGIGFLVDMLIFSPLEGKLRRQYGFDR